MDASRLLVTGFTEEFHVGAAPAERQFVNISAMNFAPDGELVVLDRGEFADEPIVKAADCPVG